MFCTHCGAKLPDNSRFCGMCGNPTSAPATAPAEPVAEVPVAPVVEEIPVAPVVEEVPVEPVVEEIPVEPVIEEAPVEPVIEEAPVEPVIEEAPAQPVVEEIPAEPVAEPLSDGPATEVLNAAPMEERLPVAPVAEEVPAQEEVPAAAQTIAEEKSRKKDEKPRSARKKPHIVLRILTQFLSFVMCVVLLASLLGTVVLADLNRIMSKNGMETLVGALVAPAPQRMTAVVGAGGVLLDEPTVPDISDVPEDILTGGDSAENVSKLVSWLYNEIAKSSDKPLTVTEEQIQALVQEPAIYAFIAGKLAGFADDFINNTQNTTVTTEEIMAVLEENKPLIEEKLDTELTDETMVNLEKSVHKLVEEQDLTGTIQNQVFESVENAINNTMASTGMSWQQIQPVVQFVCSDALLYIAIAVCVVLMLLLLALNFYNIPGGLTWIAIPCILVGGILAAALALATTIPSLIPAVPAAAMQVLGSFSITLLPIHGAVLGFGLLLLIVAIIWRAIRKAVARKQEAAAATV